MGAWIEISKYAYGDADLDVAPFVGAWIEMSLHRQGCMLRRVAPSVGAWIEKVSTMQRAMDAAGRTLRGCVD